MTIKTALSDSDIANWHGLLSEITDQEIIDVYARARDAGLAEGNEHKYRPSVGAARIRALASKLTSNPGVNAPVIILKTYSTFPPVAAQLTDTNGSINLTTATTVKFVMKGITSNTIITGTATIVTPATGMVSYTWGSTDTQQADSYQVEWAVTWSGGGFQIIPSAAASNQVIEIDADLDAATG